VRFRRALSRLALGLGETLQVKEEEQFEVNDTSLSVQIPSILRAIYSPAASV